MYWVSDIPCPISVHMSQDSSNRTRIIWDTLNAIYLVMYSSGFIICCILWLKKKTSMNAM